MVDKKTSEDRLGDKVKSFLEIDWLSKPYIYIFFSIFVISRLPLILQGFGNDTDAWLMGTTAHKVWFEHMYIPSRMPGYPIPEIGYSLFISGGWVATNIFTMIISLLGTILFAHIARKSDIRWKGLIVLTFAFLPTLWANSATTMDYMWALLFMFITWLLILKDKTYIAALFFGFALASRLTYIFIIIPFIYLIWTRKQGMMKIFIFILIAGIISFLIYLPIILQKGLLWFRVSATDEWYYGIYYINWRFGLIGVGLLCLALLFKFKKIYWTLIKEKDQKYIFLALGILAVIIPYLCAPYDGDYLIPVIPFLLLFSTRFLTKRIFVLICILLLSNSFISFGIVEHSGTVGMDIHPVYYGLVIQDYKWRSERIEFLDELYEKPLPDRSLIVVGWFVPLIEYYNTTGKNSNWGNDTIWVDLLTQDELESYVSEGRPIYYLPTVRNVHQRLFGYDLADYNATYIH